MNKKIKIKNKLAFVVTGIVLLIILLTVIIASKKEKVVELLPIQRTERLCYSLESNVDTLSSFDIAFVDLKITNDQAEANMRLVLPDTPVIEGVLKGDYDSVLQRITGTYSGVFQNTPFSETRVAQITADGFIFAQDVTELKNVIESQDISYVIPSASCERFDQRYSNYIQE